MRVIYTSPTTATMQSAGYVIVYPEGDHHVFGTRFPQEKRNSALSKEPVYLVIDYLEKVFPTVQLSFGVTNTDGVFGR